MPLIGAEKEAWEQAFGGMKGDKKVVELLEKVLKQLEQQSLELERLNKELVKIHARLS